MQTARWIGQNDVFGFMPHVGIASGEVSVGYVGTPLKYNCSGFGAPVALAARCAGTSPRDSDGRYSSSITFPDREWEDRDFDDVFRPKRYRDPDGTITEAPHSWEFLPPRSTNMKNLGEVQVRHIVNRAFWAPSLSAEDRAREVAQGLAAAGRRWQRPGKTHTTRGPAAKR